jgi:hypothetical protein
MPRRVRQGKGQARATRMAQLPDQSIVFSPALPPASLPCNGSLISVNAIDPAQPMGRQTQV